MVYRPDIERSVAQRVALWDAQPELRPTRPVTKAAPKKINWARGTSIHTVKSRSVRVFG